MSEFIRLGKVFFWSNSVSLSKVKNDKNVKNKVVKKLNKTSVYSFYLF